MSVIRILVGRYLRTRLVAWLAALAVACACLAMVVITAVMDGFGLQMRESLRGVEADLRIRMRESAPADHAEQVRIALSEQLASAGGPILALSPVLESFGILQVRVPYGIDREATQTDVVRVLGVDWGEATRVLPFEDAIERIANEQLAPPQGVRSQDLDETSGMLVGVGLVSRSRGDPGLPLVRVRDSAPEAYGRSSNLSLYVGRWQRSTVGEGRLALQNQNFSMISALQTDRPDFDTRTVLVGRNTLYELLYGWNADEADASWIEARLSADARRDLEATVAALRASHPELEFTTWKQTREGLLNALAVEKATITLILGFVVFVCVILILGLLYLTALEKRRDIGILRALGFPRRGIIGLFVAYSLVLGGGGAVLGSIAGALVVRHLDAILAWLGQSFGFAVFNPEVQYLFSTIPATQDGTRVLMIAIGAVIASILAGGVAALRAATMSPMDCLRHE